ncbi:Uncharacterised protein [Vibrio cholerae]|nr:Uncharacterised protein [Vibrio cholerae]
MVVITRSANSPKRTSITLPTSISRYRIGVPTLTEPRFSLCKV